MVAVIKKGIFSYRIKYVNKLLAAEKVNKKYKQQVLANNVIIYHDALSPKKSG